MSLEIHPMYINGKWRAGSDGAVADVIPGPAATVGGVKDSGFGREGGMASIAEMSEVKWVTFQMGKRELPF
jgi:acyl-CoA reductase-like NAD-dependent aldehyde dehydrogenase